MLLNTAKSSVITFTLKKEIRSEPIVINDNQISEEPSVKLLGIHYDKHLRFTNHVETLISKSRPAYHAIVRLKRAGVSAHSLGMFYKSRVLSILSYAAPAWFPYLADKDKEVLEKYQRLCLRVILPQLENYDERLQQLNIDSVSIALDVCCLKYVTNLKAKPDHPTHQLFPKIPDIPNLHHKALSRPKWRTSMLSRSLFFKYN